MKKGVVTNIDGKRLIFIYEDSKLIDIKQAEASTIGDIHLVRVNNVVSNIKSAFINTVNGIGVLKLQRNDDVKNSRLTLAQVTKEKHDNKMDTYTTHITIKGKYVVVKYGESSFALSKKIKENIKRYKKIYSDISNPNYFILFRTSCIDATDKEIIKDIKNVYQEFELIFKKAEISNVPMLLKEENSYILKEDIQYITDDKEFYQLLSHNSNIEYYEDSYPLSNLFELKSEIKRLFNKKINLKSGANIVIEPTEALTVIDVNSSKSIVNSKSKRSILDINIEAGIECLRQIRCRNISGIIIIDFLNMSNSDNEVLIKEIEKEALKDELKVNIYGFTHLGLVEMSRQREKMTLREYMDR